MFEAWAFLLPVTGYLYLACTAELVHPKAFPPMLGPQRPTRPYHYCGAAYLRFDTTNGYRRVLLFANRKEPSFEFRKSLDLGASDTQTSNITNSGPATCLGQPPRLRPMSMSANTWFQHLTSKSSHLGVERGLVGTFL